METKSILVVLAGALVLSLIVSLVAVNTTGFAVFSKKGLVVSEVFDAPPYKTITNFKGFCIRNEYNDVINVEAIIKYEYETNSPLVGSCPITLPMGGYLSVPLEHDLSEVGKTLPPLLL